MAKTYFYNEGKGSNITKLVEKSIAKNGVYVAKDEGADGYSKVNVNLEAQSGLNVYFGNEPPNLPEDGEGIFVETETPSSLTVVNGPVAQELRTVEVYDTLSSLSFGFPESTTMVQIEDNVYMFGGYTYNPPSPANKVYKYNLTNKTYVQLNEYPVPVGYMGAVYSAGKIYCCGGRATSGAGIGSCYEYDVETDTYTAMPSKEGTYNSGVTADEENIYCFGGTTYNTSWSNKIIIYNKTAKVWTSGGRVPDGFLECHALCIDGDFFLYVINGDGGGGFFSYIPSTKTLTGLANPGGLSRAGMNKDLIAGEIILSGGSQRFVGVHTRIISYNIASNTWRTLGNMSTPRYGHFLAMVDQTIYVINGWDSGTNQVENVERMRLSYTYTDIAEKAVTVRGDLKLSGVAISENLKLNNISAYEGDGEVTRILNVKTKNKGEEWK